MKITANIIFGAFISPIAVLYGEYAVSAAIGYIAATAILSAVAIRLLSVTEQHAVNQAAIKA